MRIVHIIPSLSRGGAERFVVDLCNELANIEGSEIFLISLKDNAALDSFVSEISDRVTYTSFGKKAGFDPKVLWEVAQWIYRVKPDVVNTHTSSFEYLNINVFFNFPSGVKVFHTVHNRAAQECPNNVLKKIRSYYYKTGSVVPITISRDGRATFSEYYGLNNDHLIVNGRPELHVTPELPEVKRRYPAREDEYLLLNVGRVVEAKNQAMLVRSVQAFNRQVSDKKCRLLIIGDLREQHVASQLRELVKADPFIDLIGAKENVVDYLSIADAFCLSSLYEGMPISLIEALSLGCIPICTPVGGIKEMLTDSVNGFLSSNTSEEAYLDAILNFHLSDNKEDIKENCVQTFAKNYHIRSTAENYYGLYSQKMMSK
ncbi:glycosyltransferase [Dyadobacter psychrophilus]|uniref:Glycosyltransferase involved in cell wall bisynthesis n=1 Tax=Dyadobacter psychrophilus TaxID=651661 RepID=A0A1T5CKD1_9BACT|nr:glycosyltransferase [Dyadobacter psychrophilus]SKB59965.1 Glycosyltransferase involved in cell wall bisynthesis [Dyadobacter psychrophilus]